ncbi:hypothetical protein LguiB_005712 [Lonicera macranthoides]
MIMPPAVEPTSPESSSSSSSPPPTKVGESRRFGDLRGVQWRIDLGVLPFSSTSSIDDLRRFTADSRRRYAALRRRLLVDPHIPKDGSHSPDLVMDNPLSQNPDSMWSRFFRSAELERMVDQDLSRLYPEHGSYFQTPACQGMLRRILLLWCLRHPEYGYRQGMHELMAPLLYVLHVDVENLSQVRKLYEDHFTDKFDGFSFHESDLTYKFDFKKFPESVTDEIGSRKSPTKASSLDELDPNIKTIVMLSDAYGAEGELGMVLSEKFMEHDAYCMFDSLMNGTGAVAMAEFFCPSPLSGSHTGLPPVIEASSSLYHLLSIVDSSLHSHLVELGVEPQYFALRWLRVLFGREFALEDLLIIWDEIFACDNKKLSKSKDNDDGSSGFGVLNSLRGGFISALAVSMILYLRSSLLATENATSCLQRLLNFPEEINLEKLIKKAKSLQALAVDATNSAPLPMQASGVLDQHPSAKSRGHHNSLSSDSSVLMGTPASLVPESYWEEKWRVMQKEAERKRGSNSEKQIKNRLKGWSERVRLRLSRSESDPSPSKGTESGKRDYQRQSVRRSLLEDLARQLGSDEEDAEKLLDDEDLGKKVQVEVDGQERCLSGNTGSEENSSIFSDPPSPMDGGGGANNHHQENESERSSVASNLSVDENENDIVEQNNNHHYPDASNPIILDSTALKSGQHDDFTGKAAANFRERKLLSGKFQWLWKFGKNGGGGGGEGTLDRGGTSDGTKASINGNNNQSNAVSSSSVADGSNSYLIIKGDAGDQNVMVSLRSLGNSMLENIQVIESVFQQDRGGQSQMAPLDNNSSKSDLVGRGQVTAMAALKELRKISNLLSEM